MNQQGTVESSSPRGVPRPRQTETFARDTTSGEEPRLGILRKQRPRPAESE